MSANLDRIAKMSIALNSPVSNDASFDNILIIGPAPMGGAKKDIPVIGVYNGLEELNELGFKSSGENADPIGIAARVAFSQMPRPKEVYVAVMGEAVDEETGAPGPMSVTDVMNAALDVSGWYCACPAGLSRNEIKELIEWTETHTKICGYPEVDPKNPIVASGLFLRSYAVFPMESEDQKATDIPLENLYGAAAAMAVAAMNYPAGSEAWALMPLTAVSPSKLSGTFTKLLEDNNISFIASTAGKIIAYGGKVNYGEWIDIIRFRDWLENDMQIGVVNLFISNPKVPFTDQGIGQVDNQMLATLKKGQKRGGIAPTEYDEDGKELPGYKTSVPLAASISSIQKKSRVLPDCKFSARLAGAIFVTEISGVLTYEKI